MLEYRKVIRKNPEDGDPVLILLHGRGSHMEDLLGLSAVLSERASLVTPQAPFPGDAWGYGGGWAWYRYMGEGWADRASLSTSLKLLEEFLSALPQALGFEPGPVVLGGFSQGGTMSLAYALSHPGQVAGVVNLSGFLVSSQSLDAGPEELGDTPLFWAHGTEDPAVPYSLALSGQESIRSEGGRMEVKSYPMGHWVSLEELEDLEDWLGREIAGWR